MNQDLLQLIRNYAVMTDSEISATLVNKSKYNLVAMLLDLLTLYYNDLNSSTLRQMVVAMLAGFTPSAEKLGYDGFRQEAPIGATEYCEIKSKNLRTASTAKNKPKLDGGGNFTDYSWKKFSRHMSENPVMLIAGFVDGQLIYIFQFNFNEPQFTSRLRLQLQRKFPNGDIAGTYLRSAEFIYRHFKDAPNLKTMRFVSNKRLDDLLEERRITAPVYEHLRSSAEL